MIREKLSCIREELSGLSIARSFLPTAAIAVRVPQASAAVNDGL
jgi:hypothetical protein